MRNSDALRIVRWARNVPTTHCKRRRSLARLICAWPTKPIHAGRAGPTSSLWPPARCAKSWLATPGVIERKYFGGLNYDEMAEVLKISSITVRRDWRFAKAWLYTQLHDTA